MIWGVGLAWHEPHDRQLDEEEHRHDLQAVFRVWVTRRILELRAVQIGTVLDLRATT